MRISNFIITLALALSLTQVAVAAEEQTISLAQVGDSAEHGTAALSESKGPKVAITIAMASRKMSIRLRPLSFKN